MAKLTKKNFEAGSPFSCWLREAMYGELYDADNYGLKDKYGVVVNDSTESLIMNVVTLDDYPEDFRKVAVELIRIELEPDFEK